MSAKHTSHVSPPTSITSSQSEQLLREVTSEPSEASRRRPRRMSIEVQLHLEHGEVDLNTIHPLDDESVRLSTSDSVSQTQTTTILEPFSSEDSTATASQSQSIKKSKTKPVSESNFTTDNTNSVSPSRDISMTQATTTVAAQVSNYKYVIEMKNITIQLLCSANEWSCRGHCYGDNENASASDKTLKCRCDAICISFGDCCPDYFLLCRNVTNETAFQDNSLDQNTSQTERTAKHFHSQIEGFSNSSSAKILVLDLLQLYGSCADVSSEHGYLVVSNCPNDSDPESADVCANPPSAFMELVSYNQYTELAFRNVHCAACFSVLEEDLIPWEVTADCVEIVDKEKTLGNLEQGKCKYYHNFTSGTPPYSLMRPCTRAWPTEKHEVEELEKSELCSREDRSLCTSYQFPVRVNSTLRVRNPHCYLCVLGESTESFSDTCSSFGSVGPPLVVIGPGIGALFDLGKTYVKKEAVLFNLDGEPVTLDDFSCATNEVFDLQFIKCRPLICPALHYALLGECVRNSSVIVAAETQPLPQGTQSIFVMFPRATPYPILDYTLNIRQHKVPEFSEIGEFAFVCSNYSYNDQPMNTQTTVSANTKCIHCDNTSVLDFIDDAATGIQLTISNSSDLHQALTLIGEHFGSVWEVSNMCSEGSNVSVEDLCNTTAVLVYEHVTNTTIGNTLYAEVSVENTTVLYPLENIFFDVLMTAETGFLLTKIVVCDTFQPATTLHCPVISFSIEEVDLVEESYIKIRKTGEMYAPNEYEMSDHFAYICNRLGRLGDFWVYLRQFDFDQTQAYVSAACSAVSVLCLAMLLMSHCLLPEMRNTAGKMTAGLAAFILTGQLLLFANFNNQTVCQAVAVLTHWVWLSTFGWMSSISIDLAMTFYSVFKARNSRSRSSFWKFSVLSLGLPLCVVAVCLAVDLTHPGGRSVGYGEKVCFWIGESEALVYGFYVPVGCSLLVNMVCFSLTLYGIESTKRSASTLKQRRQDRGRCIIYVKVSVTMGFTWTLGFVAAVTGHVVAVYAFIIFNGLQGACLFVCYTLSARNVGRLRARLLGATSSVPSTSGDRASGDRSRVSGSGAVNSKSGCTQI
ncbi:hypothetical protein V1264_015200 [Littorina saxatilis]|uniref:Uncharacterized protein n=1 Tax=Littorina saxatilis TaxID=31220 RepID=A0AAN9BL85_9CAEN